MNPERETDRRLREWVGEGVDRAPDRYVWAALDEIEQVPQRRRWATLLDGLLIKMRPAVGVAGSVAVVLFAVVAFQWWSPNVGTAPQRAYELADLQGIVLWEDTKPSTWTLDNLVSNGTQVRLIPIRSMTDAELQAMPEPRGYLGGRYTDFSGPDAVFMSWGAVFETGPDAAAALPFYKSEMEAPNAWGLGPGLPTPVGHEGFVYTGQTRSLMGAPGGDPVPAQIYLWRTGSLLLAIGGWFDYDPQELRAVAGAIDARAAQRSRQGP